MTINITSITQKQKKIKLKSKQLNIINKKRCKTLNIKNVQKTGHKIPVFYANIQMLHIYSFYC